MFTWSALRLYQHARTDKADVAEAMRLFHFSITYLSALFVLMAVDVLVRHHLKELPEPPAVEDGLSSLLPPAAVSWVLAGLSTG